MTFLPTPVQQPANSIWVMGVWPHQRSESVEPCGSTGYFHPQQRESGHNREVAAFIDAERPGGRTDFEIVVEGSTRDADDVEGPRAVAAAGATWWELKSTGRALRSSPCGLACSPVRQLAGTSRPSHSDGVGASLGTASTRGARRASHTIKALSSAM